MDLVVLCDFDGTITHIDTAELVVNKFADGNWEHFDELLESGKISLEECMQQQYEMVRASEQEILDVVSEVATIRQGFGEFVLFCQKNEIPLVILSAGIDFCIRHILTTNRWQNIELVAAKSSPNSNGMKIEFLELLDSTSSDFKEDRVNNYQKAGKKVCYVGDGRSDFTAIRRADIAITIEGSQLSKLCEKEKIPYQEISNFKEVISYLDKVF